MSDRPHERDADAERDDDARRRDADDALDALFGAEELDEGPRSSLRLDKTGALAGVPKLEPKRPYDRPERPGPEDPYPPPVGRVPVVPERGGRPREPDDDVAIAGGTYLAGEAGTPREIEAFRLDRYPVTNAQYAEFVEATGHRPPLYWPDGRMPDELFDHPVVGVDYYDAVAYARWRGKDLPFEDEWERATRGTEGRLYPWGNETEPTEANTARLGLKTTTPVGWYPMNVTPEGVVDLIGNVWEMTHSPAKGGGIVLRGGSWFDFALYAKGWFPFASPPEARNGTIGFRLVRRLHPRPDAPREVAAADVDEAIRERRGPQPSIDPTTFSPEKRDLVPDYRRLRNMRAERESEEAAAKEASLAGRPGPAGERSPRPPVKATLPPPLPKRPREAGGPPRPPAAADDDRPPPLHVESGPSAARPSRPTPPPRPAAPPRPSAPAPTGKVPAPEQLDDRGGRLLFLASVVLGLILLGLLVAGFLADARQGRDGGSTDSASSPSLPGDLPEPPPVEAGPPSRFPDPPAGDPRDEAPFRWLDAAASDALAPLDEGAWLLVFANLETPDGAATAVTASRLHRALRDTKVQVALVLARAELAGDGGALLPPGTRREVLASLGLVGDLPVVVDTAAEGASGGALRRRWAVDDAQGAVLLEDGRMAGRTTTDGALSRAALEALAARGAKTGG